MPVAPRRPNAWRTRVAVSVLLLPLLGACSEEPSAPAAARASATPSAQPSASTQPVTTQPAVERELPAWLPSDVPALSEDQRVTGVANSGACRVTVMTMQKNLPLLAADVATAARAAGYSVSMKEATRQGPPEVDPSTIDPATGEAVVEPGRLIEFVTITMKRDATDSPSGEASEVELSISNPDVGLVVGEYEVVAPDCR